MIEQQPNQDSSFNVQVPRASTPVALVLEPALRSLLLWYLEAVVAQQNAVNSTLSAQVQHLKRIVQPQQAQIEALQTLILRITQDQQVHLAALQVQIEAAIQAHQERIAELEAFIARSTQDQQAHLAGLQSHIQIHQERIAELEAFIARNTQDQQMHVSSLQTRVDYVVEASRNLAEQDKQLGNILAECQMLIGELQQERSKMRQGMDQLELRLHDLERLIGAILKALAEQRLHSQSSNT